jgi:hypothetical protein
VQRGGDNARVGDVESNCLHSQLKTVHILCDVDSESVYAVSTGQF